MCDPVSIGVTALAVATSTAQVVSQAKAAKAQTKAILNQREVMLEENRRAASAELFDRSREARREAARIRTAAGEAGLSLTSGSVEAMLMDSAMQQELAGDRTLANYESRNRATNAEAESMLSHVQKPTALGAGLTIAGSAAEAYIGSPSGKKLSRKYIDRA
ncbi:virion core protein, T7 gp14 family [Sphingosinicella microcystinivorans]|uniref:Uncharacterized protein n=1 Tax=Sphingosinicella microcystinivorans TaxID=335406 RepID=A0AAD1G206_SPHMI|nr:hypothetical protein [Sphingosinicella microcystinivorans]RKS86499.1 hypothetical protein DFR51_3206 [Sphingosinicella microcystinivorans]BBE35398.1 hypothetical protein SmB9_30560 [Sphingosinicella microcystinivorans]